MHSWYTVITLLYVPTELLLKSADLFYAHSYILHKHWTRQRAICARRKNRACFITGCAAGSPVIIFTRTVLPCLCFFLHPAAETMPRMLFNTLLKITPHNTLNRRRINMAKNDPFEGDICLTLKNWFCSCAVWMSGLRGWMKRAKRNGSRKAHSPVEGFYRGILSQSLWIIITIWIPHSCLTFV